jgi:hypothetical protein
LGRRGRITRKLTATVAREIRPIASSVQAKRSPPPVRTGVVAVASAAGPDAAVNDAELLTSVTIAPAIDGSAVPR